MNIQLNKADRFSFPTGIMDLAISPDGLQAFAATMDGIYVLALPPLPSQDSSPTNGSQANGSQANGSPADGSQAEGSQKPAPAKLGATPKPLRIGVHGSYVSGIAWIAASQRLITTAYDGTLHFRDLAGRLPLAGGDANAKTPSASEPAATENVAVEPNIAIEPSISIEPSIAVQAHRFWSWGMAVSPDQRWIASVTGQYLAGAEDYAPQKSDEPTVKIFDAATGQTLHALEMLPSVQCVAFDPTSQYVAAGNLMGDLAVWEVSSGKQLAQWRSPSFTSWGIIKSHCYIGGVFAVTFSRDSQSLYAAGMGEMRDPMAGNGKQLWQRFDWRAEPVQKTQEIVAEQSGEGLMETLAWHPSGEHFLMAGRLRGGQWNTALFNAQSGTLIGQAKTGMRVTSACYSPDGTTLYLAGMQGQPAPKEGRFGEFGFLERYILKTT